MKNNSLYIALAAVIAFIGAVVYAVLYYFGILPTATIIAVTGIIISLIVLSLLTFALIRWKSKNRYTLCTSLASLGKTVVFSAVVLLCISVLFLSLIPSTTALYIILLFVLVFFWKFLLILWGVLICFAIPDGNSSHETAETSASSNDNGTSSCCNENGCGTYRRYNY